MAKGLKTAKEKAERLVAKDILAEINKCGGMICNTCLRATIERSLAKRNIVGTTYDTASLTER